MPTPTKIRAIRDAWAGAAPPASGDCSILTGLGALYAGFDMEQGTEGFMTGFAFPEILRAMNAAAQAGDFAKAHALYQRFLPLIVFEQQPGVAVPHCHPAPCTLRPAPCALRPASCALRPAPCTLEQQPGVAAPHVDPTPRCPCGSNAATSPPGPSPHQP